MKQDLDLENIQVNGDIEDLEKIMQKLLSPNGCPWDKEQTHKTLAPYSIEEAHELAEAIEENNTDQMKEELGDLLFQVIFHSALAAKNNKFTLKDVIKTVSEKLIRRHPHVFSTTQVSDSDEVLKNWNQIKSEEKKNKPKKTFDIPIHLPALQRAQKIGDKTKVLKFDWQNAQEVFFKVEEEIGELKEAFGNKDKGATEEELGDVFFVLAQFARHLKLEAETVARGGNKKFEKRFDLVLKKAEAKKLKFDQLTTEEKERLWIEAKKNE